VGGEGVGGNLTPTHPPLEVYWKYTGRLLLQGRSFDISRRRVSNAKVLIIIVLKESSLPLRISNELLGYEMLLL